MARNRSYMLGPTGRRSKFRWQRNQVSWWGLGEMLRYPLPITDKVITTMVTRPLDDRKCCSQTCGRRFATPPFVYVGVGDGPIRQLVHRFLLAPYWHIWSISYRFWVIRWFQKRFRPSIRIRPRYDDKYRCRCNVRVSHSCWCKNWISKRTRDTRVLH